MASRSGLKTRKNKPTVSITQLRILLSAIENDPSLYNASESDMISFLNIHKWLDLSDKLNECYGGALLDTQQWKYVSLYYLVFVINT